MIRFVGVLFGGAAITESKVGKSRLSVEEEEGLMRMMDKVKEKEGTDCLDSFIVNKMMDIEDKATGGNELLFWMEKLMPLILKKEMMRHFFASFDLCMTLCSLMQHWMRNRAHSVANVVSCVVEWCVNNGYPKAQAGGDALLAQLGLFSDEWNVLLAEYVKSSGDLDSRSPFMRVWILDVRIILRLAYDLTFMRVWILTTEKAKGAVAGILYGHAFPQMEAVERVMEKTKSCFRLCRSVYSIFSSGSTIWKQEIDKFEIITYKDVSQVEASN